MEVSRAPQTGRSLRPPATLPDVQRSGASLVLASATLARLSMAFQYAAVAAMGPTLVAELGLSLGQLGLLVALYTLPAIALALPIGLLSQRYGDINSGIVALILLTLGGFGGMLADGFGDLAVARVVAGAGATSITIVSGTILSRWFAGAALGRAMSVSMFSWPLGLGLALAVIPFVSVTHGVSAAFAVMGMSSAVPLGLYLILAAGRIVLPIAGAVAVSQNRMPGRAEFGFVILAALLWVSFNGAFILLLSFGPVHIQGGPVSVVEAGLILSLVLAANGLATLFAGRFSELFGCPSVLVGVCSLGLAAGIASLLIWGALPAILVGIGLFSAIPVPIVMALIVSAFADRRRNLAIGIFYALSYTMLAGLLPSAGLLGDMTVSTATPIWTGVALAVAAVALLPSFFLLRNRIAG